MESTVVGIAATDGPCMAGDKHGILYGFRTKYKDDAELLWTEQLAGTGNPVPAMADGTAHVARGQFVTAVNRRDLSEEWEMAPGATLTTTPPAIVGGTASIGNKSGLYALDVSSGGLEWGLDHGGEMGPPAIANGALLLVRVIRTFTCSRRSEKG